MPTTPNYGWPTPADADYVKDGALAMRDLGNAADATTKTVADAAAAAQSTANAAIPKSTVTTNGDLIKGTGAGTVDRIAPGTNGQVLTIDAGVPTWLSASSGADTWTLISSQSLTSGSSHTFSSISGYRKLRLTSGVGITASGATGFRVRINTDTGNNYARGGNSGTSAGTASNAAFMELSTGVATSLFQIDCDTANQSVLQIFNGTSSGFAPWFGLYGVAGAITDVTLLLQAGTFSSGTLYLYGVAA
jgi:hypothetical protein